LSQQSDCLRWQKISPDLLERWQKDVNASEQTVANSTPDLITTFGQGKVQADLSRTRLDRQISLGLGRYRKMRVQIAAVLIKSVSPDQPPTRLDQCQCSKISAH